MDKPVIITIDKKRYTRVIGTLYLIGSVIGLLIGLAGLIALWSTRPMVERSVAGSVALMGRTLAATQDTIAILDTSLQQAGTDLDTVQKMMGDISATLDNSRGMIDTTANLVGGQLVDFFKNTSTSLESVQSSATVVDNMLRTITGIPLIGPWLGGQRYNPPVPLGDSIANVKKSMDPLPGTLTGIQKDLKTSSSNVATIKGQIDVLTTQVDAIRTSINESRRVVSDYRQVLNDLQSRYQTLAKHLPLAVNLVYLLLTLFLLWILITQAGLLLRGLALTGRITLIEKD